MKESSKEELIELYLRLKTLEKSLNLAGPRDDDELHEWVLVNLGVDIPRVAVCKHPEHQSPFQFFADLYFERIHAAIAVANRGGSKTFLSAILHMMNSKFKPRCWSAQVGAVEAQSKRAYSHVQHLLKVEGHCDTARQNPDVIESIQSETRYKNGSIIEVLGGTVNQVNGPHPQKVGADEVELMDPVVFDESRNMSASAEGIMAQDWITSTRKRAHGQMQKLLDECAEAERAGFEPPYAVYFWCCFEVAANVPECGTTCGCDRIVKGKWDDGKPRTFKDVCKGRLAKSQGWIPLHDLHKTFRTTSRSVWEAQQECLKPSTEGLVLQRFDRNVHGVRWYVPDMANGWIVQGVDWGTNNPAAVNWYQWLNKDVLVHAPHQERHEKPERLLKKGTKVCFDEIYRAEIGNVELGKLVLKREAVWRRAVERFVVVKRFADPQGLGARKDWVHHDRRLRTDWHATRDVKEHIKTVVELVDDELIAVDVDRCPMFIEEAEDWHYPDPRKGFVDDPEIPVDDFNHCMSNFRYVMENLKVLERRFDKGNKSSAKKPRHEGRRNRVKASDHRHVTADTRYV